jgi:hypothetical protein
MLDRTSIDWHRPRPREIYVLLRAQIIHQFLWTASGSPVSVEGEYDHIDPFTDVGRLRLDLNEFFSDVFGDCFRTTASTECFAGPSHMSCQIMPDRSALEIHRSRPIREFENLSMTSRSTDQSF